MTWIYGNMPFSDKILSHESFKEKVETELTPGENETLIDNFYQVASNLWKELVNPSIEDIHNVALKMVASSVTSGKNTALTQSLMEIFLSLINKKGLLVTDEMFTLMVKFYNKNAWIEEEECKKITHEFYTFATKFVLVDFPITRVEGNFAGLARTYLKDKAEKMTDKYISYIENSLERRVFSRYEIDNKKIQEIKIDNIYKKRLMVILYKFDVVGRYILKHAIQSTKDHSMYKKLNETLKMEERFDTAVKLFERGNVMLHQNILKPTEEFITYKKDALNKQLKIMIKVVLDKIEMKNIRRLIHESFTFLKSAVIKYTDGVLHITIPKDKINGYMNEFKEELRELYHQIKNMDKEEFIFMTNKLYKQALSTIRRK
jgi:hypothetical protein